MSSFDDVIDVPTSEDGHVKGKVDTTRKSVVLEVRSGDTGRFRRRTLMLNDPELKEKAHEFISSTRKVTPIIEEAKAVSEVADRGLAKSRLVQLYNEFPETDLEDLPVPVGASKYMALSFLILGQSRMSGKTKLLTQMYKTWFKPHKNWITILFAANLQNPLYEKFKKALRFNEFHEGILDQLRTIQRATDNHYTFVVILDDIVSTKHREFLNEAVLTYRNSNIYIIISTQYYALISPSARTNFSWMFLGKFTRPEAIEKMSKGVLMDFPGRRPEDKWPNYAYLTRADHDAEEDEWTNRWIVDSSDGTRFSTAVTC